MALAHWRDDSSEISTVHLNPVHRVFHSLQRHKIKITEFVWNAKADLIKNK